MAARNVPQVVDREHMRAIISCLAVVELASRDERRNAPLIGIAIGHCFRPGVDRPKLESMGQPPLRGYLKGMVTGVAGKVQERDTGISLVRTQEVVGQG